MCWNTHVDACCWAYVARVVFQISAVALKEARQVFVLFSKVDWKRDWERYVWDVDGVEEGSLEGLVGEWVVVAVAVRVIMTVEIWA